MWYKRVGHCRKCTDCGCKPWDLGEDFYVRDGLWLITIPAKKRDDVICIGCFEKRLGRKLTRHDFKPWFRNNRCYSISKTPLYWRMTGKLLNDPPSKRLADRLQLSI